MSSRAAPRHGWLAPAVAAELPGLQLVLSEAPIGRAQSATGPSPPDLLERLSTLSNGYRGARAVSLRQEPIPAAYRVFFRHIGLDPDVVHTPIEAAVLERLISGGFLGSGLLADALLVALIDTGIGVWALDADTLAGPLGIRASVEGEPLGRGRSAPLLPEGRLVVADSELALASLFGELAPAHRASAKTRRVELFAVQVEGVPDVYVEEALWSCCAALEGP